MIVATKRSRRVCCQRGATMKKLLPWIIAAALLALLFYYLAPGRHPRMSAGSYEYARKWCNQLLACHSLEEVKQYFNCIEFVPTEGGGARMVSVTAHVAGRPQALVDSFPDGKWIACAYGDSHGGPGGGTIVTRDSDGVVHVFFGHVCGEPGAWGKTLDEFYERLRENNNYFQVKEVLLK